MKRTPIPRKRPTLRRGELSPAEKEAIRRKVYEDTGGRCVLRKDGQPLHPKHIEGQLPWDGPIFTRWHLVHLKARRRFGWDGNVTGGCYWCHIEAMHGKGIKPDKENGK